MSIKPDFKKLKIKINRIRKVHVVIVGAVIFLAMGIYLQFPRKDNFKMLMEIDPKYNFSVDQIKEEEWDIFQSSIEAENNEERELVRNIFHSYSQGEDGKPELIGIILGKRKTATFSDGQILQEGDSFNSLIVKSINRGEVVLVDKKGEKKVLELWRQ
ncbi:hypothetical protein [uncultured Ilyobacter sp.]|uniref:hypothetical protein n=1 Tax=uncultured Ilyobacter sp. TaxID=544433 RepID=UPI0029C7412A|nr:hypothetical protein [uncultured Ilyobacter sp.]